jgi:hypothetical protein
VITRATYLAGASYAIRLEGIELDASPRSVFVHDFVRLNLPFDTVVGAFANFVSAEILAGLLQEAWLAESAVIRQKLTLDIDESGLDLKVAVGTPRARQEALVVPISWSCESPTWIPPLEADLEAVAFGPANTHLHILGTSDVSRNTRPCTDQASLEQRLAVAVVRHVLFSLAQKISSECLGHLSRVPPPDSPAVAVP